MPPPDPDREPVLDPGRPPAAASPALTLRAGPLVLALVALFPVGIAAQAIHPAFGLVWTQLFVFLIPAAALAARDGLDPVAALRLGPPPRGALGLAALAGAGAFLAAGALMALWTWLLPSSLVRTFDVTRIFGRPGWELAVTVGAAALLAPLCEEAAFRGHLLTALARRHRPAAAVALSAAGFAALHLDPVRLPALLFLGLLYGWLSWRAGSVWPAVLAHAVNNAAATALALQARTAEPAPGRSPLGALGLLLAGLATLAPVLRAYHRTMPPSPEPASALVASARRPRWVIWAAVAGAAALLLMALLLDRPAGATAP